MYGGVDKYSGDIAFKKHSEEVDPFEVMKESNCFETIVAKDTNGKEVFIGASIDLSSGELEWNPIDAKDKTLKNVMGMSQMSSMLKDKQRNEVYNAAITKCIHDFISTNNRKPYVLDIGCGTGLLSMQAARAGAAKVYGCEMFPSWCEVARANVKENGLDNIVTIINKHSSKLIVKNKEHPRKYDLARKCDILVSEILDTALLGEGVLIAVQDARKRLLVSKPIIIPEKADVFVELIRSEELKALTQIEGHDINSVNMQINNTLSDCKHTTLLPIHYDYLKDNTSSVHIDSCSPPQLLTTVDLRETVSKQITKKSVLCSMVPNGMIFSWKVYLYQQEFTYSTLATDWTKDCWQDHWMQGYYALPEIKDFSAPGSLTLVSEMTSTNWRFDLKTVDDANSAFPSTDCHCGFHQLLSPGLFGQYNDPTRNEKIKRMLLTVVEQYTNQTIKGPALVLGDDSFIGTQLYSYLQNSNLETKPLVYSFENKELSLMIWKRIIEHNGNNTILVSTPCNNPDIASILHPEEIGSVFWNFHHYQMEDHCIMEAISYWCMVNAVRQYLSPKAWLCPSFVNIMGMAVELGPLYDSFGEVSSVNGFKHSAFNENMTEWNSNLYPFPLYMYEYKELSKPQAVMTIDFSQPLYCAGMEVSLPVCTQGTANCVVLWCEYYCGDKENFEDIEENWQTPYHHNRFVPYKKQLLKFRSEGLKVKEGDSIPLRIDLDEHLTFHVSFTN